MIGIPDEHKRQVIPRWHDYITSCILGMLRVSQVTKGLPSLHEKESRSSLEWDRRHNLNTAIDLVSDALILKYYDSPKAIKAAHFIIKNAPTSLSLTRQIANYFLETPAINEIDLDKGRTKHEIWEQISNIKRAVRSYPFDPIGWSDLSLYYASIGQLEKCRKAMEVALSLGKFNRFILLSASRCFFHIDDPDYALNILRRSDMCECDPWIASAEIAISDWLDSKSVCLKLGKQLVKDQNISPFSKSELAACLGTIEIKNGSFKKGKNLIREALRDPSENAVAQAEWLNAQLRTDITIPEYGRASYEAQSLHFFRKRDFSLSIEAAEKWYRFQPFSSRPLILATYISSVCLGDDRRSITIIQSSSPAHLDSPLLMNNLAFSYARIGELAFANEALSCVTHIRLTDREAYTLAATKGLICFREGNASIGRQLYKEALEGFDKIKDIRSAAIGSYFWALEEKRLKSPEAKNRLRDAKKRVKQAGVIELVEKIDNMSI